MGATASPAAGAVALAASPVAAASAAALYGFTSISIAFVNKAVLSVYMYKDINVMLTLQARRSPVLWT